MSIPNFRPAGVDDHAILDLNSHLRRATVSIASSNACRRQCTILHWPFPKLDERDAKFQGAVGWSEARERLLAQMHDVSLFMKLSNRYLAQKLETGTRSTQGAEQLAGNSEDRDLQGWRISKRLRANWVGWCS